MRQTLGWADVGTAFAGGAVTLLRVVVLVALASLVWVPFGIWIGLRPSIAQKTQPLAQFLAAFPANVLFPFVVIAIVAKGANPAIWLSPLMILGSSYYSRNRKRMRIDAKPASARPGGQTGRRPAILPLQEIVRPAVPGNHRVPAVFTCASIARQFSDVVMPC